MESLGFLLGAALLAGFIVLGLRSLTFGIRTRSKPDAVLGAVFLSIAAFLVVTAAHRIAVEDAIDWNPSIESDAQVLGRWEDDDRSLELLKDGSFTLRTGSTSYKGKWTRSDWNLSLVAPEFAAQYRFVRHEDDFKLLEQPSDDESWNYWAGLRRIET